MPEFTKREQEIIDRAVKHYLQVDEMRTEVKSQVDDMLLELADFIEANYNKFLTDTSSVLRGFVARYIKKHGNIFKSAVKEGVNFVEDIL